MAKKKTENNDVIPFDQLEILENNYLNEIDNSSKYSLEIDPENHYNLSISQKDFIRHYVQYKNIPIAAKLSGIDEEDAIKYFNTYSVKMEIRRINLALYHRAFATKILDIDGIGGYLTSLLIGENIAEADKLSKRDKLQVVKLLMEVNQMKQSALSNPDKIIDVNIVQDDLEKYSVAALKEMIKASENPNYNVIQEKEELLEKIRDINPNITPEEEAHLKSLTPKELKVLLEAPDKILNNF